MGPPSPEEDEEEEEEDGMTKMLKQVSHGLVNPELVNEIRTSGISMLCLFKLFVLICLHVYVALIDGVD